MSCDGSRPADCWRRAVLRRRRRGRAPIVVRHFTMSTARGLKVIKNNVNKNTEYKSEF